MMNKIKHLIVLMICLINLTSNGQMDMEGNRGERIAELRKSFVAERLQLNADQDKKFWPLYDQYVIERKAVTKKIRKSQLLIDNGGLTEMELNKAVDELSSSRKTETELDAAFIKNSIPIIGVDKASQLALIEREFKKTLLRKIKERRQQRK